MNPPLRLSILLLALTAIACAPKHPPAAQVPPVIDDSLHNDTNPPTLAVNASGILGTIERLDPALDALLAPDAKLEILAEGIDWCEGPVWFNGGIHFSDV